MVAEFSRWGLNFQFPENWTLDTDGKRGGPRSVSVHSPDGAFWSVTVDGPGAQSLTQHVAEAIREEYDQFEMEAIERPLGDQVVKGFELNFYCLDFLITAHVLSLPGADGDLAVLYQAESRDFERLQSVFDAISLSLLHYQSLVE